MQPREDEEKVNEEISEKIREYWTGEGVDCLTLWNAYSAGKEVYIKKFRKELQENKISLLKLEFEAPSIDEPLFNLEVVYKTLKALYYGFKRHCLTDFNEFNEAGPLYVNSIERGSIWWHLYIDSMHAAEFICALVGAHNLLLLNKKTKLEIEKLEKERDIQNQERLKNKKNKIAQENIDNFIRQYKPIIDKLLSESIKSIILEGKFTINLGGSKQNKKKKKAK